MATSPETSSSAAHFGIDPAVYARRWKILTVLCTSLMVVMVGNTALNVALPTLARDLHASISELQWMVDAYGLVFAGLLLTAGTIGDRYGRKGALQFGLAVFLSGSLFAAFMDSATAIVAGRAVMGFGAAFVMPATLSILTNVFPPHERGKAIAIWAGISGGGAAIGPVASGFLLEHFSWGSIFLVNVPIIAVALIAGYILLAEVERPRSGAARSARSVAVDRRAQCIGVRDHRGPADADGPARRVSCGSAAAAVLLALFLMWELRNTTPMLNLRYFLDPRFGVAAGVITLVFFAMFGFFFLLTQYFQLVLGYDPLEAGIRQLPFAAVMILCAPQSPRLAARFGVNRVVAAGLLGVSGAMALFTLAQVDTSYLALLPVMMTMAAGMSLTIPSMTGSIMSAVPLGKAGVGSATNDTTRELGGALGVAVLGSLVAGRYDTRLSTTLKSLPADVQDRARESLAGALQVAREVGGPVAGRVADEAKAAYVSGMHLAAIVAASVCAVATVFVYRKLPSANPHTGVEPTGRQAAELVGDVGTANVT